MCKALQNIVFSTTESETGRVFYNCQIAIPIQYILEALNYPQPPTPIKTDNSAENGFACNDTR